MGKDVDRSGVDRRVESVSEAVLLPDRGDSSDRSGFDLLGDFVWEEAVLLSDRGDDVSSSAAASKRLSMTPDRRIYFVPYKDEATGQRNDGLFMVNPQFATTVLELQVSGLSDSPNPIVKKAKGQGFSNLPI
ncbi:hypothetical protein AKJ16_DCAP22328 [Drosera capensis]